MPRPDAAKTLATALPALQHPDGTILRALGFSTFLQQASGDQAAIENINALAYAHAEAIIHTLENTGYILTHKDDPKPIDAPGTKTANIHCTKCKGTIVHIAISDDLRGRLDVTKLKQECPHG